jgi:hypothetical protein
VKTIIVTAKQLREFERGMKIFDKWLPAFGLPDEKTPQTPAERKQIRAYQQRERRAAEKRRKLVL